MGVPVERKGEESFPGAVGCGRRAARGGKYRELERWGWRGYAGGEEGGMALLGMHQMGSPVDGVGAMWVCRCRGGVV